jgi:phosphatidylcholine synthase
MQGPAPATTSHRLAAWLVHGLTASGAVLGFLALEAAIQADASMTFLWLGLALIVDGIDGPLARALDVERATPNIDGAALDLVVDYLTYVLVPVAYMATAGVFPSGTETAFAAFVLLTSLYTFARRDMKSESADFRGFPAVWNLVAAGFAANQSSPWACAVVTIVLGVATFTNLKAVHPIRVVELRWLTMTATAIWLGSTGSLIAAPLWLFPLPLISWWITTAYFVGLCAWRSWGMRIGSKKGA